MINDSLTISAIAAMSENRVIGLNNQLPWHIPADLKHFKNLTTQHAIVMGRKTFESIGKPLPNRLNIVLTRNPDFTAPGCRIVHDIAMAKKIAIAENKTQLFIIGGAEIYQALLPMVSRLYLTIVHQNFEGDAYFPTLNHLDWQEVEFEKHAADIDNPYEFSFVTLQKVHAKQLADTTTL